MTNLIKLLRSRRGAGMTEYIILVGVVAIFAIAAFRLFGQSVKNKISQQGGTVEGVTATEE